MEDLVFSNTPKFKTPEEEVQFLREHIARRESELKSQGLEKSQEHIAGEVLDTYRNTPTPTILHKNQILSENEHGRLTLKLRPENHDRKMEELLGLLLKEGIKNTLDFVQRLNNPHIDNDFHRFLVQYLISAGSIPGLKERTPIAEALHMKLFEVTLPEKDLNDTRTLKEVLSVMEQFYSGMQLVGDGFDNPDKQYFTLELGFSEGSDQVIFYAAVPKAKADLFQNQLASVQPKARVTELTDDYNIFSEQGQVAAAYATLATYDVYPLRTYEAFDHDPLSLIINAFTKLKKVGEGASIQFIFSPGDDSAIKRFHKILDKVKEGESVTDAIGTSGFEKHVIGTLQTLFNVKAAESPVKEKKIDELAIKHINEKIQSSILPCAIRIVVSAESEERAQTIIRDLEAAFNQFSDPTGNRLTFQLLSKRALKTFLHEFSYRLCTRDELLPLNLRELATLFHFPSLITDASQLKQSTIAFAPAPRDQVADGVLLGINNYRGTETEVKIGREDRMRHFYIIGQTGTGKTNLLKSMILQDIQNGDGVCYIDPHGSDVRDILSNIPKERLDDVVYFDPSYVARPIGLNMLEYDSRYPEQKTRVVDELLGIFRKLFGAVPESMGPAFEQYFRNAALLVMEDPESGSTLLEIGRVLSDKAFRQLKLERCKNPIITQFWTNAERTTGESALANYVQYVTNKFDVFITNEIMRPIIAQEKSAFNVRDLMDNKKILLVNLAKGRLGDINANLLGLILVGKIQMAALSRVDMYGKQMSDFFLYIDEFQNITTDSISSIFSEARKYRLSLTVAHQYINQLDEGIKNSVFGNVGSMAIFRVSPEDSEVLKSKFEPTFSARDLSSIENYNAYVNMLVNGSPAKPFNIKAMAAPKGNFETVDAIQELSYMKYGKPREEVEQNILERYKKSM